MVSRSTKTGNQGKKTTMPKLIGNAKKQKISVADGNIVVNYPTIGKTFKARLATYGAAIHEAAKEHGFKQKFGDAASGKSPAEKYEEVQKIHASLLAGEWERTATHDLTPLILEAVSRVKKVSLAVIEASVKKHPEQVADWAVHSKVRAEIAKIRQERAEKLAEESEDEELEIEGID
jgi:hypothetical protein